MFLDLKAQSFYIGESQICDTTKLSVAPDDLGFDGNTILLELELQRDSENKKMHFSGYGFYTITTKEKIFTDLSSVGKNMISHPSAMGKNNTRLIKSF